MKKSSLHKILTLGLSLAGAVFIPSAKANVTVNIEGGSASSTVLFDRATNFFLGGSVTITGGDKKNVLTFAGTSTNPAVSGYGTITLNINVANGAINGLNALVNQTAYTGDTNAAGQPIIPTFVDSASSPEAVGIDSVAANLSGYPTYVVPLVYVRNTNFPDVAAITNLTQRQAVTLETTTNKATFYGGTNESYVFFVGRNKSAAVRTEIDAVIVNTAKIKTFTTNVSGLPVQDASSDPGLSSASTLVNVLKVLTNSIGTVAVQNATTPLGTIAYEGVPYSVTNVINGSYPLWGYENYYFITSPNAGAPSTAQQAVIDTFYQSVTNSTFQTSSPIFVGNYVPNSWLKVKRNYDGGPIIPLANY